MKTFSLRYSFVFLLTFSLLLFDSCTFYPRYKRPCMDMPEHWRITTDETTVWVNIKWWEQFDDPVLTDLILEALDVNNDLRAAAARIAQFRAQLGIVSSQLFPQIYGDGTVVRERISQTIAGQDFDQNAFDGYNYGYGCGKNSRNPFPVYINDYRGVLTVAYELDIWGKIRSATKASYAELLGEVDARRALILSVVSSVASSYILLRQYDLQLKISTNTLKSREESYRLAKLRFQEGLTSELEVAQSASERDQAAIQTIQYQTLISRQENLLSILVGHPPTAIQRGRPIEEFQLPPQVPAGLPSGLLEQRPDILQAEEQLKATNFRIGEARALYFPELTLTGFYGSHTSHLHEFFADPSRVWQWMIHLLQPIFTGGKIGSEVDLAKARKCEAVYNYLQVILNALKEVDDALISHQDAKRTIVVEKERVKHLTEYLHLATLQYDNGLVDYLNVLDAERLLFDAQLDLAKDQADVFISLVNIYKALGGGWVIDAENLMKEEWASQDCP